MNSQIRCLVSACFTLTAIFLSQISHAQQSSAIKLKETIRGNQEQPRVLTIVPWQSPKTKEGLPSPIIERINKKFLPLQREELKRQIKMLDSNNTKP